MSKSHPSWQCMYLGTQQITCQMWSRSDERFLRYTKDKKTDSLSGFLAESLIEEDRYQRHVCALNKELKQDGK